QSRIVKTRKALGRAQKLKTPRRWSGWHCGPWPTTRTCIIRRSRRYGNIRLSWMRRGRSPASQRRSDGRSEDRMMRLLGFAIYLGIGALLHALILGPHFDWTSAWTFGWLFAWPLMLFIWFWIVVIGILVAAGIGWAMYAWLKTIAEWRARRKAH